MVSIVSHLLLFLVLAFSGLKISLSLMSNETNLFDDVGLDDDSDSSENATSVLRATLSTNPNDVDFYLYYDRRNPDFADRLILNDRRSVLTANFVIGQPVIFVTHGFLSGYDMEGSLVDYVKNAYLKMGFVNIIAVDWRRLAKAEGPLPIFTYYKVVENGVPICGKRLAKMIIFLMKTGIISGPAQVHLVGHSLGAHCSGIAGSEVKMKLGTPVQRISGLDPAGPFYNFIREEMRLDQSDATYVDVTHTDIGQFGTSQILGHVDWFFNGGKGKAQPNCLNFTLSNLGTLFSEGLSGICAHSRAYEYFARSILRTQPELYGCRCIAQATVIFNTCISPPNMCQEKALYGQYIDFATTGGTYYINVGDMLPGLGIIPQVNVRP